MTTGWLSLEPLVPAPLILVASVLVVGALGVTASRRRHGWVGWSHRAAVLLLAALAALGPHVGSEAPTYQQRPETQVVVALDATASMAVRDQDGSSRWQTAVADAVALAGLQDGSFALVTWGLGARLAVPFTTDSTALDRAVTAMDTERPIEGVGSRVDRPLAVLSRVLAEARQQHPERETMLLLLSDGENTAGGVQRPFAGLARLLSGGLVVGYGTEAGGAVPLEPGRGAGFVPDPSTGVPALSRREGENLRQVAVELGVEYLEREDVGTLVEAADALEPDLRTIEGPRSPQDVTWMVGLLLLVLVALELRFSARGVRELREMRKVR